MLDDSFDKSFSERRHSNLSSLERNCSQILERAPTLTKEFFDKINGDVPTKTDFLMYHISTRRFIVLTGLALLFTISTMGTFTMWFTNWYQKRIETMMILSEESHAYSFWRHPPIKPIAKFYLFNYTNVAEFSSGRAQKLHVEQVGPYSYSEELEKVNVRFSKADGTVSYQEKRTYKFVPEESNGSPDDAVVTPNVPLLSGAAEMKNHNYFMRLGYSTLLSTLNAQPFSSIQSDSLITGYNDNLFELAKSYLKWEKKRVFESFGLLAWKQNVQPEVYTMNTGIHDINKLGIMESYNGISEFDFWNSYECNRIQVSDGLLFPLEKVKQREDLEFFIPQTCRKFRLEFQEETMILEKVPVYKYKLPLDVFDSVDSEPNQCYCNKDLACPPKGLYNATLCSMGAPLYYSWPHMHGVDPVVKDGVTGQLDSFDLDDTYMLIHPKFGNTVGGKMKMQVNIRVETSFGVTRLSNFPDGLILPLAWVEMGVADKDLNEEITSLIYKMTFTVKNVELGLKYGFLLATMTCLMSILIVLKEQRAIRSRVDSIRRAMNDDS